MPTISVTDATFEREVLQAKLPVLVDFWAAWCAPCRTVAPILEELADEHAGKLIIAKVDVDASPKLQAAFRIQSIPTLMFFRDGRPVQLVQGALPKPQLTAVLAKWMPELKGAVIAPKELAQRLSRGEKLALLDLRRVQDFDRSHLRHSRPVDPETLAEEVAKISPDSTIVLICRTGEISLARAEELRKSGREALAIEKGLLEWEGSGLATFSTKEEQELDQQAS